MIRRSKSTSCDEDILPIFCPTFARRTVVILSTITKLTSSRPVRASAGSGIRRRGAETGVDVSGHTVTDSVPSKRSSCSTTAGRGFEAYMPPETDQISPLITPPTEPRRLRQRTGHRWPGPRERPRQTPDALLPRTTPNARREPTPEPDGSPARASGPDAHRPYLVQPCRYVTCNAC